MSEPHSAEDALARYTADLLAERRPRLAELTAGLGEGERADVMGLLAVVRGLKAAHHIEPAPSAAFLRRLDELVRDEIAGMTPDASRSTTVSETFSAETCGGEPFPSGRRRFLDGWRSILRTLSLTEPAGRWRFAAVTALVLILLVQVQPYRHLRQLEQQNQMLLARLELFETARISPLALPGSEAPSTRGRVGVPQGDPILDELLAGLELRRKVERRVLELKRDLEVKTGADRRAAEILLQELQELLHR